MANFVSLKKFISTGMKMQHIYQPIMIRTLLEHYGTATVRSIAEQFLQKDESQIEYYMQITKSMPGKVLSRHGIVRYESGRFFLNIDRRLTQRQKQELISMCKNKVENYETARGKHIWLHRAKDAAYVPGSLRYEVLKKAKFRCELCGILAFEKALDVDHIVPRNKGGKTFAENLQALCYTCNAQKRDLDDTDFRPWKSLYEIRNESCVFCKPESRLIRGNNTLALALEDRYPVTRGHTLITPSGTDPPWSAHSTAVRGDRPTGEESFGTCPPDASARCWKRARRCVMSALSWALLTLAALALIVVLTRLAARANSSTETQRRAATAAGASADKQILFGDLHVHTTFSTDAFLWSLPMLQGDGAHPIADACDYARFCSSLDFWSINDHDFSITPRHWRETVDSIRQCNDVAGDPANPDMVAYLGWEWTQVGTTPEKHYGHKNVVLQHLDDARGMPGARTTGVVTSGALRRSVRTACPTRAAGRPGRTREASGRAG